MVRDLARVLIGLGSVLLVAGVVLFFAGNVGLGHLPGDITISRGNFRLYAPLGTCLLLSIVLTVILSLFGRR